MVLGERKEKINYGNGGGGGGLFVRYLSMTIEDGRKIILIFKQAREALQRGNKWSNSHHYKVQIPPPIPHFFW